VPEWTWNDGWVLMSLFLAHAETGAALHEIIAAADATNHAIPTAVELSRTLTSFAKCGLISFDGNRYRITSDFLPGIKKAYDGRGGLFSSGDKGLKWLRRSRLTECVEVQIDVNEMDLRAAYQQYVAGLRN